MKAAEIFKTYACSVFPIGWMYSENTAEVPVHKDMLMAGRYKGQTINVLPYATAFLLSINEDKARLVTASHAFPDPQRDNAELCIIVPPFLKCPYEVSPDDFQAYPGILNYIRQKEQDICVFDVDTPEAMYLLQPTPIPLGADYMVGDEVCTIGYPFIGYEGTVTAGKRDMRIVERLTCAHLSAIWPYRGTLTLEFDNYVGPGNSGGPLINIRTGAVIGVVTWSRIERQHHSVTSFSHATSVLELGQLVDLNPDQHKD